MNPIHAYGAVIPWPSEGMGSERAGRRRCSAMLSVSTRMVEKLSHTYPIEIDIVNVKAQDSWKFIDSRLRLLHHELTQHHLSV
jgi:hypothetical protein